MHNFEPPLDVMQVDGLEGFRQFNHLIIPDYSKDKKALLFSSNYDHKNDRTYDLQLLGQVNITNPDLDYCNAIFTDKFYASLCLKECCKNNPYYFSIEPGNKRRRLYKVHDVQVNKSHLKEALTKFNAAPLKIIPEITQRDNLRIKSILNETADGTYILWVDQSDKPQLVSVSLDVSRYLNLPLELRELSTKEANVEKEEIESLGNIEVLKGRLDNISRNLIKFYLNEAVLEL